jgi:hypothetical protein
LKIPKKSKKPKTNPIKRKYKELNQILCDFLNFNVPTLGSLIDRFIANGKVIMIGNKYQKF